MPNIIEATILTGSAKGENVFIPRIPLIPSDTPFDFKRLQYPVRLSFAMTINKAQGQSLSVAGINLESSCFSHGQPALELEPQDVFTSSLRADKPWTLGTKKH
jgi:ATP-dependent DNA helicase PIF1